MTDAQILAALIGLATTLMGALCGVVRWSAARICTSIDDSAKRSTEAIAANTTSQLAVARQLERLSVKIDRVDRQITPPAGVPILRRPTSPQAAAPTVDDDLENLDTQPHIPIVPIGGIERSTRLRKP